MNNFLLEDLTFYSKMEKITPNSENFCILAGAFLGLVMICLAFMSSKLGGLTQATYTIMGIMNGPSFGVYFLGLCVPFSTKKGAAAGLITALVRFFSEHLGNFMDYYASIKIYH